MSWVSVASAVNIETVSVDNTDNAGELSGAAVDAERICGAVDYEYNISKYEVTAEQWIKEGKNAVKWTKLSCHDFADNQVRLQLFALAYNLGNFLRRLALSPAVKHWSLTTLREKLIKIGAKVVAHFRYVVFQMAEVAVPKRLFRAILERIRQLRLPNTVPR